MKINGCNSVQSNEFIQTEQNKMSAFSQKEDNLFLE